MKSIIVPVNFTECALNAAHYAADMALAMEADLHILHVVEIPASPAEAPIGYVFDQIEKNAAASLQALSEDLLQRTRHQVSVNTLLEIGSVQLRLREACDRLKPFIVVMGAPGDPYQRLLAGSDSIYAARHLPYPLLVVPVKSKFHAIRKIAIACELAELQNSMPVSQAFLRELKEMFTSKFEIINVTTDNEEEKDKEVFELYRWKESMKELVPALHFVKAEKVEEGIMGYLTAHDVDWLMVFPRRHGLLEFHRSQSKRLVLHCPVPVLSICEP